MHQPILKSCMLGNMSLLGLSQNKVVLLLDDELSTYKGVRRLCEGIAADVYHFVNQIELQSWLDVKPAKLTTDSANNMDYCLIFDAKYLELFQNLPPGHFFLKMPQICISRSSPPTRVFSLMNTGLFDFVEKPFVLSDMATVIEKAFGRYHYIDAINSKFTTLSKREYETCKLVIEGNTNKQISNELNISIKTVKVHRANLMRKVQVKSVPDLLRAFDYFSAHAYIPFGIKNAIPKKLCN